MAGKLVLTVGVPGCGKSTWAQEQRKADPNNIVVIERDEVRTQLFGEKYHRQPKMPQKSEAQVTQVCDAVIHDSLQKGKTVIVSNTNLNPRLVNSLVATAENYGVTCEVEHFDVPPEVCRERNRARGAAGGREVPDHIMDSMIAKAYDQDGHLKVLTLSSRASSFLPRETDDTRALKKYNRELERRHPIRGNSVVLVDVDGTLSHNPSAANQAFGVPGRKSEYAEFFRSIEHSPVNESVRNLANTMRANDNLNIMILTGRSASALRELTSFLDRSGVHASRLIVKRDGDNRPDYEFKKEAILNLKNEGLAVVHSIDDRERSIRVSESLGISVSRVPEIFIEDPSTAPESYPEPQVSTVYGSGYCIRCGARLKNGGNIGPKCATEV